MHWLAALIILAQLAMPFAQRTIPAAPSTAASAPAAQAEAAISDRGVTYQFGQQITFKAIVQPGAGVSEVWVYFTPEGMKTIRWKMNLGAVENTTGGDTTIADAVQATAQVDVSKVGTTLSPFSNVTYYYQAMLQDGKTIRSAPASLQYDDNRFTWQKAANNNYQVYWNGPETDLGQTILGIADDGLRQAQGILDTHPPKSIRIYAYSSSRDLQYALQLMNQPYIAGHAAPEMAMILISVPSGPERKLELERQIPHEIMHILQYQVMGEQFTRQPVWLVEGMASLAELTQNPEYRRVLETTVQERKLLPISSLCATFPADASGAFLAYAQSDSFVRFLHQKYGTSGLKNLIEAYKNGVGCEEGVSNTFGISLRQLEYRWQQESLGMNAGALALSNLSPYLLLGLVILIIPVITFLLPYRVRKPAPQGGDHV